MLHRGGWLWLKRPFDTLIAGAGLLGSAPRWGLIAVGITRDEGGPVFYGQTRVGQGGRPFQRWKVRSMIPESDQRFGPLQASRRDARVTRMGRLLRGTALDERPQLWNILKGEMRVVGPRALLPEEIEVQEKRFKVQRSRFTVHAARGEEQHWRRSAIGEAVPREKIPGYEARHRVRPGLTGVAQISAARDIPRRYTCTYDLLSLTQQRLWLDVKRIGLSCGITCRGTWEHRGRKVSGR
jgi:lipopolysaccharide/colanic/teichoic acid biosynthesis glycosyltransferase